MDITSNRIPATPRSKYHKYSSNSVAVSGGTSADLSNYVKLKGGTSQTIEGEVGATGDIIAYKTGEVKENYPIASTTALGTIKVGENLTITKDGTLNAQASGISSWNDLKDKPTEFQPSKHTHTKADITDFSHTHQMSDISGFNGVTLDTDQLITGQKTFSKTVLGQSDIVAYSTGISKESFPIASSTAIGCVKIGDNINVSEDGTISVNVDGGEAGSIDWENIKNKPSTFTPSTHNHDDRYYTEAEINTKLNSKSNTDHTHSNYASTITTTGTGNAVTSISQSGNTITVTKGATYNNYTHPTSHPASIITQDSTHRFITDTERTNWNDANSKKHTHSNKSYLDVINQKLATTNDVNFQSVKAVGDIIAYSTGNISEKYPIASTSAVGCVKIGSGLAVTSDGTISVSGGTSSGSKWGEITGTLSDQNDLQTALNGKASSSHTHNYASTVKVGSTSYNINGNTISIPAYPTTLKNPNALTISLNGTSQGAYDGSAAKSINITASSVGAAASSHTHSNYASTVTTTGSGNAITAISQSGNTITATKGSTFSLSNHTHSYIPLSGGTMTGGQIARAGASQSWKDGRVGAILRLTSAGSSQYMPIWSCKSQSGSWDCGTYTSDRLHFSYITDANYNAGTNTQTANIYFNTNGTITAGLNGNATTATTLATSRTINGTSFNGSANITTANWGTARSIGIVSSDGTGAGSTVSVNGSGNVNLKLPATIKASITGNVSGNAGTATKLQTSRTLWGQSFNGSANISGNMTGVGSITASGLIKTTNSIQADGDVVAYKTGTSGTSPFKYWLPSVDTNGNLSWTNSTSTTTPTTRNIKGPTGATGAKGATGATGKQGQGVAYQWSGTSLRLGTIPVGGGTTTWGSYVNLKGDKGDKGATGSQGPAGTLSASSTCYLPSSGTVFRNSSNNIGVRFSGGNGITGWASAVSGNIGHLYLNSGASSSYKVYITNYSAVSSSDIRLKTVFNDVPNVLDKIQNISAFYHTRKDEEDKILRIGVSAQAVKEVFPEVVQLITPEQGDSYYAVDYTTLAATVAINGCKELHQLVKDQQIEINKLREEINQLKKEGNDTTNQ